MVLSSWALRDVQVGVTGMCLRVAKKEYHYLADGTTCTLLTRLKTPEAKARHLFFDPEWLFNFGYPSVAEDEKRRGDETMT
jgi:hypothetical protein